ncbi:hypothetical protein B0H13DRAFT_2574004 [Mycena leptocephala]|nr:hypothetical protein B0H13DRAFT_2574004 [Mycena leptocephala]
MRTVSKTRAEKRRAILIDLAIGLGIPLLQIPLQYIVPGHCHNIFEDIGCLGETYEIPVTMVLFHLPPSPSAPSPPSNVHQILLPLSLPILPPPLCLRACQPQPKQVHPPHGPRLHQPPPNLLPTLKRRCHRAQPRVSWADTHSNFSRVVQVPGIYWRADPCGAGSVETLRRATVARALLFFGYFGFADGVIKNYCGAFHCGEEGGVYDGGLGVGARFDWTPPKGETRPTPSRICVPLAGGVSLLEYEDKEKGLTLGDGDAHALTLGDASGMLPDYKESRYSSPSTLSASPDTESVHSAGEEIEVSPLCRASVHIPPTTTLTPPEPAHIRRSSVPDVPMPVVDTADDLSAPFHLPPTLPNMHTDPNPTRTPSYASENSLICISLHDHDSPHLPTVSLATLVL